MLNIFKPGISRSIKDDKKLGAVFGWIGGYVNGIAFAALGVTISHMSGNLAKLGKGMGNLHWENVLIVMPMILCFIFGAAVGNYFYKRYSYPPVLVSEAFLLMLMNNMSLSIMIFVGAFAMGLHNAFTTSISRGNVRTSHITNSVTDIGISLARGDIHDVSLKILTVFSFMWGAAMGVMSYQYIGQHSFVLAGSVILVLLAADALRKANEEDYLSTLYRNLVCKILDL